MKMLGGSMRGDCIATILRTPLLQLAKHHKFESIEEILFMLDVECLADWIEDFSAVHRKAGELQALQGTTMLHLLMKYKPPATLVHTLIFKLRELRPGMIPEDASDMFGKTPLHVAVFNCCDFSVVERLVNGATNGVPALSKDAMGRLPLHWACANPRGLDHSLPLIKKCGCTSRQMDNMNQIIELLVKIHPFATSMKDNNGMTPLSLAIQNGADQQTILTLERAHRKIKCSTLHCGGLSGDETEETTDVDIPAEISNEINWNERCDDLSSVGTGGISKYRFEKTRKMRKAARPLPYVHEQLQI